MSNIYSNYLSLISTQRKANENHYEIPLNTEFSKISFHKYQVLGRDGAIGTLTKCWWVYKLSNVF